MQFITFYFLYFLLFLQYENFVDAMIRFPLSMSFLNHGNGNTKKIKVENISNGKVERNGKKILFVTRNRYFSEFQIFLNLANKLDESGYIVHLIIAHQKDAWMKRESELSLPKLNSGIVNISIPLDENMNFYQALSKNPSIKIMGIDQPILHWLSGHKYALGMGENELYNLLDIFDKLKIRGSIIVSGSPLKSLHLHLLDVSLPKTIPEFLHAIPGDGNGESGIREASSPRQTKNIEDYKVEIEREASSSLVKPKQFARQVRYALVNQHPLVQFHPRNWSPYLKFIGGIHIEEFAHKMKEHGNRELLYPNFDCLVLFSIGTVQLINLQEHHPFVNIVLNAFAAQPKCHFIVGSLDEQTTSDENKKILKRHKNIEIVKGFVPQREILAQPNMRLFISHCGQNSLNEAVYAGVPIICIPFAYDQFHNAAIVEFLGNGKHLTYKNIGETLQEAINEMLKIEKNRYRIIAQKLKEMIMSYPKRSEEFISVVDKAILELEEPNVKPNLTAKSIKGGWKFDNPILADNFITNFP